MTVEAPIAVLLAAGQGTRMRPVTHAVPKELFPLGGRTVIDNVADDLLAAGCERIVVVTSAQKPAIDVYLREHLGPQLQDAGVRLEAVRQRLPGTGGAFVSALDAVPGLEAAGALVVWGDEVFSPPTRAREVLDHYLASGATTIATAAVADEMVPLVGIVEWHGARAADGAGRVAALLEKPDAAAVQSRSASVGGQLLTSECCAAVRRHVGAQLAAGAPEASLALSLAAFLQEGGRVEGIELQCAWFETGSWRGYAEAFLSAARREGWT